MNVRGEEVGRIIGEASVTEATFISKHPPRLGEFVVMEYDGKEVLGMIQYIIRGNLALNDRIHDPEIAAKIYRMDGGRNEYVRGYVKILGSIQGFKIPKVPPPPGTIVFRADESILKRIFGKNGSRSIKIGTLLTSPDVPVYLDVNSMVTRHLAILAITGAGKSNTVAIITREIVNLGGTVVVFDMHADYVFSGLPKLNAFEPRLNPYYMSVGELAKLLRLDTRAHVQERLFRIAYRFAKERVSRDGLSADYFLDLIKSFLRGLISEEDIDERIVETLNSSDLYRRVKELISSSRQKDSIQSLLSKIEDFEERLRGIVDPKSPDAIVTLRGGASNIINLSRLDEEDADVVVSHYLRRILYERKRARLGEEVYESMKRPILIVLEEAHILAPKDRDTLSKHWISRIAREGRKFGVGLCLVSQRPKGLDPDALSQVNNMIILKLVEPTDQRHVQQASEQLSEDLLAQLPSLNVGEAVIIGPMTPLPVMVKIDKFDGRLGGADINVFDEWINSQDTFNPEDLVGEL